MGCMDADSSRRGSFFYSKNSEGNPSHTCLSTLICLSLMFQKAKKPLILFQDALKKIEKKDELSESLRNMTLIVHNLL